MNRRGLLLAPLVLLLGPFGARRSRAESYRFGTIEISHPWAEPPTGDVTAVFMTLADLGDKPDHLVGATTPVASTVLFQERGNRPVAAFDLRPKQSLALRPGGDRIVLQGVKLPLAAADAFPLTLRFTAAGDITVVVPVEHGSAIPAPTPAR